jgi:DNA-binding transcriptional LysR family regulator
MATDRLGDLHLFVEASTLGSLSAAGRKLGLSPAAASARLGKLESVLRTRLFDRTTRQLRLTDEGRVYLQHCQIALQALADADAALEAGHTAVRGKLRISASTDFGRNLLSDWIEEFTREHPEVRIALTLTDSLSKLVQDDIDLAIRFGAPDPSSGLISRRLAPNWRVLCASPGYVARKGAPRTPDDLAAHDFIVLVTSSGPLNEYDFVRGEERWTHTVAMDQSWETNDGALVRRWALAGHGITRKTIWDAASDLRDGSLKILLPDYIRAEPGVYAVLHRTRYAVPRVRQLIEFLVARFAQASEELAEQFDRV